MNGIAASAGSAANPSTDRLAPYSTPPARSRNVAPMSDPERPRPNFALKPKAFTPLNAPAGTEGKRIDVRDHLAAASAGRAAPSSPGNADAALAAAQRSTPLRETKEMTGWIPRRSRRRRDYWFLAISGGLAFGFAAYWVHSRSAVLFTCVASALVLYEAALAWIMWQIMDDY